MNILSLKGKREAGNPLFGLEEKMKATLKDIGIALLATALCFFVMYGQWIFLPV